MIRSGGLSRRRVGHRWRRLSTGDNNLGLLREAIARHAGIVLSLPLPQGLVQGRADNTAGTTDAEGDADGQSSPALLRHYKSRFLADAGDGLWVASVPADSALVRELVERRYPVGVSFRSGQLKVMFAAPLLHVQDDYARTADGEVAGAMLLRFPAPADVRAVQRRRSFRVPVAPGCELEARVWLMPEDAHLRDRPLSRAEVTCELRDISVGGLGITILLADGRPVAVAPGDRVRVQLTLRDVSVLLEGRLRHPPRPVRLGDGLVRAGVQFRTLGEGRDDRLALVQLNKIVAELQREAIRRRKLGAA